MTRTAGSAAATVEVARSFDEAEAFRPAWERLQNSYLTSDIDFVLTYCRHTPGVVRPHAVLLQQGGEPVGLVVARLEDVALPAKLGYRVVMNPTVRALTVVYGGFLGEPEAAGAPRLLSALAASLGSEKVDVVRLRMLPVGSPLHAAARGAAPALRRQRFPVRMPHWRSALTESVDEFLARRSRRRRETVRRYSRRLERAYGDDARVEVFRARGDLDRLFADSQTVHRETYQHVLGVGFSDETVQRRLTELAMDRGWFRGYVLYLRGAPVAFWHGNVYRGVFGIGATGFDPSYAADRPGTYLLMKVISDLCAEGSVHTLDFGFGDADYKRHFGDETVDEEDVSVFSARPRLIALNAAQTAVHGTTAAAKTVAARTGAVAELRRRRRAGSPSGLMRGMLGAIMVLLAAYTVAGLAAGPANARGPERTMSSELVVDGARRQAAPAVRRGTQRATKVGTGDDREHSGVAVARTLEEVESLRPLWQELQGPHLTSDLDYFLTYMRHAPNAVRPHVVRVEPAGAPPVLVVGRLEEAKLTTRLGYKTVFSPTLSTLTVVYGGVLGRVEEGTAPSVLAALRRSAAPGDAELLRLRMLRPGSPLHAAAAGRTRLLRERFVRPLAHWTAALPDSVEEFLARKKKKVRWQARRDAAQLQERYGDGLEVRVYRTRDALDRLYADSARVHRTTYQHALGVGFADDELHRRLTELAMDRGWFRGYVLYLRGEPVAFWHGTLYRGVFGLGPTGFDPAYAEDRPGGYLLMRLIEDLCADPSAHTFDFGFGDATYKSQLGDECRLEEDVVVYAPRPRPVTVSLVRTALQGTQRAAKRVLAGNGRAGGIKRRWRARLSSRTVA